MNHLALADHTSNRIHVTPETPKLEAMLAYASLGLKTFLLSSSKVPVRNCQPCEQHVSPAQREACPCLQCHGFYAATTDLDRIREMNRRMPGGLVAMRTGRPSGMVVIDIDTLDGHGVDGVSAAARARKAGVLPDTATADTGSGGTHLAYAHPDVDIEQGAHKLGRGLDVKGDGGYFVVAPSRHPTTGRPYRWHGDTLSLPLTPLHPRLVAYLRKKPAPVAPRQVGPLPEQQHRYVTRAVEGEVQAILDSRAGGNGKTGRNDQLNRSAFILGTLVGAGALSQHDAETALTSAAYAVGLDVDTNCNPAQIARTIRSGMAAGMRNPRRLQGVR